MNKTHKEFMEVANNERFPDDAKFDYCMNDKGRFNWVCFECNHKWEGDKNGM